MGVSGRTGDPLGEGSASGGGAPVVEGPAEDLLEHGDVVGAALEQLAALLRAEGGPSVRPAELEGPRQRAAGPAPDLRRGVRAGGGSEPDDPAEGFGPQPGADEPTRGVGGDRADPALLDAEGGGDGAEGLDRAADEREVAQYEDAVPVDVREEVGQLLAVATEPSVVPERCPAGADAILLGAAGGQEVRLGLEPVDVEVHPVRVRA